jgi:hypothetical protein
VVQIVIPLNFTDQLSRRAGQNGPRTSGWRRRPYAVSRMTSRRLSLADNPAAGF